MTVPSDRKPACVCPHSPGAHSITGDSPVVGTRCFAAGCDCPGWLIHPDDPIDLVAVLATDRALDALPAFDPAMLADDYLFAMLAAWRDEAAPPP